MNMPANVAIWLQSYLEQLIKDDLSCVDFALGRVDGLPNQTDDRWQLGVDTIYRLLKADLISRP